MRWVVSQDIQSTENSQITNPPWMKHNCCIHTWLNIMYCSHWLTEGPMSYVLLLVENTRTLYGSENSGAQGALWWFWWAGQEICRTCCKVEHSTPNLSLSRPEHPAAVHLLFIFYLRHRLCCLQSSERMKYMEKFNWVPKLNSIEPQTY